MESQMPELTARQTEVLRLIAQGHTYQEIARLTGLQIGTIRTHANDLFEILHVSNRTEATILALGTVIDLREAKAAVMRRCWAVDIN